MPVFMYGAGLTNPNEEIPLNVSHITQLTGIERAKDIRGVRARMSLAAEAARALPGLCEGDGIGDFEREINCGFDYRNRILPSGRCPRTSRHRFTLRRRV